MLLGALALAFACAFGEEAKELGVNSEAVRLPRLDGMGDNGNAAPDAVKTTDVKLPYEVVDGTVVLGQRNRNGGVRLLGVPRLVRPRRQEERKAMKKYVTLKISSGELVIPDAIDGVPVRCIGSGAFSDCKGLVSVTIPSSVTSIVARAFSGCNITSFSVDASNVSYSSRNGMLCAKDGSLLVAGVNGNVTIPDGVTNIGDDAFCGCSRLRSVTIPDSVTSIGEWAFFGCDCDDSLFDTTTIPGVGLVDGWAVGGSLFGDLNLTGVRGIANSAFRNCGGLTSVTIPSGVTTVGREAFSHCTNLTSVTIGNGVTSIGDWAFYHCTNLTGVTIPDSVTNIGERAFSGCSSLTSVTIPDGVTIIGDSAFNGCSGLKSVTIPDSVTTIGKAAFYNCTNLASVTIGSGVTSIGPSTFYGCTNLTSVTIGNNVASIGSFAFSSCSSLTSVVIPNSVTNICKASFGGCSGLTTFIVETDNPSYKHVSGLLVTKDGKALVEGVNGEVMIPNGVTTIRDWAFDGRGGLKSVSIPNSVGAIGRCAFTGCGGLMSIMVDAENANYQSVNGLLLSKDGATLIVGVNGDVAIPEGVTSIGDGAFAGRTNLTGVTIPDSVTNIGERAFSSCNGLVSVTIPKGVMSIGDWAFYHCTNLTGVTIPDSVTNIDSRAFFGCKNLASVDVVKEGKVERVSFHDFCKQWKLDAGVMLPGFRRGLRLGPRPGGGVTSLRERRAQREAARKEDEERQREEQRRALEALKAERKAKLEKAEAERRAREGK